MKNLKRKGDAYERELAGYLNLATGLDVQRRLVTADAKNHGQCDLDGVPGLSIEAKRVETLRMRDSLAQAKKNCVENTEPVVITRRNRDSTGDSNVVLSLDSFLRFYIGWLKQQQQNDKPASPALPF